LQKATILTLVPAVLKCIEKPLALRAASINSIVTRSRSNVDNDQKTHFLLVTGEAMLGAVGANAQKKMNFSKN
jgi:hypothetical protein